MLHFKNCIVHTHGLANAEHTTLLLNTYTEVGDVAKVGAFVRSGGRVVVDDIGSGNCERRRQSDRLERRQGPGRQKWVHGSQSGI